MIVYWCGECGVVFSLGRVHGPEDTFRMTHCGARMNMTELEEVGGYGQ
jgi:hypothetical protein